MPERTGLELYALYGVQTVALTSVTAVNSFGLVTGGGGLDPSANFQRRRGIGGQEQLRPGRLEPEPSLTVQAQNEVLAALFKRASYPAAALTYYTVHVGNADLGHKFVGCKPSQLEGKGEVENPLEFTYKFMGLGVESAVLAAGAALPESILQWFEGVITVGGADLKVQSFDFSLNNNLQRLFSLAGGAAGQKRWGYAIKEGPEELEASFETLLPNTAINIFGDTITNLGAASIVYTDAAGGVPTNSVSLVFSNLRLNAKGIPIVVGEDLVLYTLACLAPENSLAITGT